DESVVAGIERPEWIYGGYKYACGLFLALSSDRNQQGADRRLVPCPGRDVPQKLSQIFRNHQAPFPPKGGHWPPPVRFAQIHLLRRGCVSHANSCGTSEP